MKKVFLTIALAAFAFAANAQFVVGGNLGFNTQNTIHKYDGTQRFFGAPGTFNRTTSFDIDLYGGYAFTEDIAAGLYFNFATNKLTAQVPDYTANIDGSVAYDGKLIRKFNSWGVGVWGEYKLFQVRKMDLLLHLNLGVYGGKQVDKDNVSNPTVEGWMDKVFGFNATLYPVMKYQITEHARATLGLNFMGLVFNTENVTNNNVATANKDDVWKTTYFGLQVQNYDMTIAGFNSTVSMGVEFTF